jgi:hypothetical protein
MTTDIESRAKLSPRDFLKARRPERFSDSVRKEIGKLDRSVLEYQLATLNKRNLELAFEDFAKKLCEKVICPNLLEQTGPVAGDQTKKTQLKKTYMDAPVMSTHYLPLRADLQHE